MRQFFIALILLTPLYSWAEDPVPYTIGVWQVVTSEGEAEFITIGPQGAAIHSTRGVPDSNGAWRADGETTIVYWQNGWTDVISEEDGVVTRRRYEPGKDLHDDPTSTSKIKRLESGPSHPKAASWGASIILENCAG